MISIFRRKPDFVVNGTGEERDYLRRWWIWPRNRWANAYLHVFHRSDDARAVHDHPWFNVSIILRGRYREHFHDGTSKVRKPGHVVFRSARALHRLELLTPAVTTIFLTGPRVRTWGFQTPDKGWIPHTAWDAYVAKQEARRA